MKKVLLVEDDKAIRQMFATQLTADGFQVILAEDGKQGIEKAKSEKPDAIIMDIVMPRLSGIDALKLIRSDLDTRDIPVLMLTNLEQEALVKESLNWGAVSYLVKASLTPKELTTRLKSLLAQE